MVWLHGPWPPQWLTLTCWRLKEKKLVPPKGRRYSIYQLSQPLHCDLIPLLRTLRYGLCSQNANTHKSQAAAKMQKLTILSMERTSTFVHRVSLILCTQFYFGIVLKLLSHNLSLTYSQHMWTLKWVILLDDHINILSMTERHPHDSRKSKMSTSRETTSCTWREENVTPKAINRQQLTGIHYYCSIPQQSIFLSWNSQSISEGTVGMPSKFHKWFFGFH